MTVSDTVPPAQVRVTRLRIDRFRAIRSAVIEFGETVALVGQNGSGKSSILRALNAFFNYEDERADFTEGRHAYSKGSQAIIEITLEGVPDEAGIPRVGPDSGKVHARLKFRKVAKWECWSRGKWLPMPSDFHLQLAKHISYALVPTRRDHDVVHNPSHGLLERAVSAWVTQGRRRDRTSPQMVALGERLQKNSLTGLVRQLRKVAPLDGPFSFELKYTSSPDYKLLLANLALFVQEGDQLVALADSGSGTQSMAVFALYSYLAELQSRTYLLGLEEPEQNLHPQAQQQLMKRLAKLQLQVVFTTHSPTVVDALEHEQVVLCRRRSNTTRGLEVRISQITHDFFQRYGLDREKYYKFHRRRNSDFMFADFVVVTEGPTDSTVIATLLDDGGTDRDSLGMSLVDARRCRDY